MTATPYDYDALIVAFQDGLAAAEQCKDLKSRIETEHVTLASVIQQISESRT